MRAYGVHGALLPRHVTNHIITRAMGIAAGAKRAYRGPFSLPLGRRSLKKTIRSPILPGRRQEAMQIDTDEKSAAVGNDDPFTLLPNEIVMLIAVATDDVCAMACLERTCRRMCAVVSDDATWRLIHLRRHGGPAPHERFAEFGKDWRWLYRAQLPVRGKAGRSVGLVAGAISGRIYMGDLHGCLAHGYGRASWMGKGKCVPNPRIYEGQWFHDAMHGRGACTWHNGERYDGDWIDGKQHGHGIAHFTNGRIYDGQWACGAMYGRGVCTWPSGGRYEGDWADGKRHGKGTHVYSAEGTYDGGWWRGKSNGHGVFVWPNGARYEGDWTDGKRHGRGSMVHHNGDIYEGNWAKGKKHGRGVNRYANGDIYEGDWRNGKMQ